jgi:sterol desaturase/sphingolipid hydroxylase (fatty acid hydroxylase superfamily)
MRYFLYAMLSLAVQFVLGLLYANAGEWLIHKHILHGLGRNRNSFWAFHWYEHHAVCAKNDMFDPGYRSITLTWNAQTKEWLLVLAAVLLHIPLFILFPVFTGAVYISSILYCYKHRKAHLNPIWAKQHLRWHYDHHMSDNRSANWCVTWPWFDYLMGTRVKNNTK